MPAPIIGNQQANCANSKPFVNLNKVTDPNDPNFQYGVAPVLNYNVPHATVYDAVGFVEIKPGNETWVKKNDKPANNFWDINSNRPVGDILLDLAKKPDLIHNYTKFTGGYELDSNKRVADEVFNYDLIDNPPPLGIPGTGLQDVAKGRSSEINVNMRHVAEQINKGRLPVVINRLSGEQDVIFVKEPVVEPVLPGQSIAKTKPKIMIVLHYKIASYYGNYGAGETIRTFSLLPGEKTTITVRHYESREETRKKAESALDSFSTSSAEDLQKSIDNEVQFSSGLNKTDTYSETGSWNVGGNAGINLGFWSASVNGGASGSSTSTKSAATAVQLQTSALNKAVSHHVAKADANRNIQVNSETNEHVTSGFEETVVRQLENLNKSRTLNFVFRQLNQEFITITYIDNITLLSNDGFPENRRTASLWQIDEFLSEVCETTVKDLMKSKILSEIRSLRDYNGERHTLGDDKFLVCADSIPYKNCSNENETNNSYAYLNPKFSMSAEGKTVKGLIVDVQKRVMRTPSLIVDSILGQGEALDCYNIALQQAAVNSAYYQNELELVKRAKLEKENQLLDKLNAVIDGLPVEVKAEVFKQITKKCCDTPQCTCGCNNNTPT